MKVKEEAFSIPVMLPESTALDDILDDYESNIQYLKDSRDELVRLTEKFNAQTPEIVSKLKRLNKKIVAAEKQLELFRKTFQGESE